MRMVVQRVSQGIRDVPIYISQNTERLSYNPGDDNLNDHYKLCQQNRNAVVATQFKDNQRSL
jgi:hypothetical protein